MVAALDLIVQITRQPDGHRCITHISEIVGIDPETQRIITEDVFVARSAKETGGEGKLFHTGYIPRFTEELIEKGFMGIEVFT
jgi:hypothetical protein